METSQPQALAAQAERNKEALDDAKADKAAALQQQRQQQAEIEARLKRELEALAAKAEAASRDASAKEAALEARRGVPSPGVLCLESCSID